MNRVRIALIAVLAAAALVAAIPSASSAAEAVSPAFRVSNAGPDGDLKWRATYPSVATSTKSDAMLVVWIQDLDATQLNAAIFGRLVNPVDRSPLGAPFQISETGAHNSIVDDNNPPGVTYNPIADEYLVAWNETNDSDIWVKRVSAAGAPIGMDIQIGTGYSDIETINPVFSPEANEYFVVWKATTTSQQIWGQRLAGPTANEIGTDIQISQMSSDADDATNVAYSPALQRYLVVWHGRTAPIQTEQEIYGQLLTVGGAEIGGDFRISSMGPDGSAIYRADPPVAEWNSRQNEWLVGWSGDDNANGQVDEEREVFVQRLSGDGAEIGVDDLRVTRVGTDGATTARPSRPSIAHNPNTNEYLVAWHADEGTPTNPDEQWEIWAQRLDSNATPVGEKTQLSDFKPDSLTTDVGSYRPFVAYSARTCNWTVANAYGDTNFNSNGTDESTETEVELRTVFSAVECNQVPCPVGTSATVKCYSEPARTGLRYVGTSANETFIGTDRNDLFTAGAGRDNVRAGSGNDTADLGSGNDKATGGNGNDTIRGRAGKDSVKGGKGNERIFGGTGNDKLYGEAGRDRVYGESGNDIVSGGTGNDSLSGGKGKDRVIAGKGKDKLKCGAGKDRFRADSRDRVARDCRP